MLVKNCGLSGRPRPVCNRNTYWAGQSPERSRQLYTRTFMSKPSLMQLQDNVLKLGESLTATDAKLASVEKSVSEIRTALGLPILQSLGDRFRKNLLPLASPLISATALILGYFYFVVPRQERRAHDDMVAVVNSQFEAKLKEHHVDDLQSDVSTLKGQMATLLPFLQMVVQKEMKTLASLPVHDFQDSLTRVNVALAAAKATQTEIPTSTIGDLRSKLVQVSRSTPYYWGTATALIGYKSKLLPNNLPNCFDKPPVMTTQTAIPRQMHYPFELKVTPPTYKDVELI